MNTRFTTSTLIGLLMVLAALCLVACQPIQAQDVGLSEEELFTEAVMGKEAAYESNDLELYLSYFAEDTLSMAPDFAPTKGKAQLAQDMQAFFDTYEVDSEIELVDITISGDYATRTILAWDTLTPKDGSEVIHASGSCVAGWKKIDGKWQIVWEIWNSEPLPAFQ